MCSRRDTAANSTEWMVGQAGQALEAITTAVDGISATMTHLASAAEEQTAVANEINQGIVAISDATHEGSAGMTQLEAAGRQLTRLAGELRDQAGRFRA
ncbi:methyl-accepting chemotaxis protein [uncultured Thiocystis sp.]|jgi:methyl-accepting chemotaxis protein|uniref:methyl-accepting chemotaxis protein n=1 Tax=uncultured Thiocystis sp. TaxID=1202134 RepID=UPI0025F30166|nr:methyl-accepting chemotaxis protein [uncultured Thiocystis sp.]